MTGHAPRYLEGSPRAKVRRWLVSHGARFPRTGDVYEAVDTVPFIYFTSWRAPFTGSGKASLLPGDRVCVRWEPSEPDPVVVRVAAVDDGLERRLIPASDREHSKYAGFYIQIETVDLFQKFKLIPEAEGVPG
jgi:hypothetical protein